MSGLSSLPSCFIMLFMDGKTTELIAFAFDEDFAEQGDITSEAIFQDEWCEASLISKEDGVLAGQEVFSYVFSSRDPSVGIHFLYDDGDRLPRFHRVARLVGKARIILSCERTALNFLGFLTGIATTTRQYVEEAKRYGQTMILDTRKTLPGFRALSKYAVRVGGANNHRSGLFDMVLIKDNHIDASGSLPNAVERVRAKWQDRYAVEVECRTVAEVRQALECRVDRIMLDNMDVNHLAESLRMIGGKIPTEISGGVDFDDLKVLVPLGATWISIGSLTHSVKNHDFSIDVAMR